MKRIRSRLIRALAIMYRKRGKPFPTMKRIRERRRDRLRTASADLSFPLRFALRNGGREASHAQLAEGMAVLRILNWAQYNGFAQHGGWSAAERLMSRLFGKFLLFASPAGIAASEDLTFTLRFALRNGGREARRAQLAEGMAVLRILDYARYGGYARFGRVGLAERLKRVASRPFAKFLLTVLPDCAHVERLALSRLFARFLLHVDIPDGLGLKLADEMCRRPHIAKLTARRISETNQWMASQFAICKRRKLIIILVWKSASRTLVKACWSAGMEIIRRMTIEEIFRKFDPREYYVATFVRHPVERFISNYRFLKYKMMSLENNAVEITLGMMLNSGGAPNHLDCFADFARFATERHPCYANKHWAPQVWQVRLPDGRLPNFIGRVETLDADWKRLQARFPHLPALPHLNASRSPVPDVGREELRILRRYYAEDFEAFGYE